MGFGVQVTGYTILRKIFQKQFLLLFVIALALRLLWFFVVLLANPQGFMLHDSWGYWKLASNLDEAGVFSMGSGTSLFPDSMRTPLYPLLIFLFKKMFLGIYGVVIVQVFVSAFVCVMVAFLTEQVALLFYHGADTRGLASGHDPAPESGGMIICPEVAQKKARRAGIMAGAFIALDFPSIFFSNTVLTETFFTFLLLLAFCSFFSYKKNGQTYPLVLSAVFLGMAILCRPVAFFLPLVFAFIIFMGDFRLVNNGGIDLQRNSSFMISFKRISVFLLASYLVVAPWFFRNYRVFGSPFLTTVSEVNLLFHTAAGIRAKQEKKPLFAIQDEYKKKTGKNFDWTLPAEAVRFAAFCRHESWRVIKGNPAIFLENYGGSFFYFFAKPLRNYIDVQLGISKNYESVSGVTDSRFASVFSATIEKTSVPALLLVAVQLVFIVVFFVFSFLFLFLGFKNNNWFAVIAVLIILYFAVLSGLTEVDARMRVPVIPFICMMAGLGASALLPSKHKT